jgi:cell division protein FtsQ
VTTPTSTLEPPSVAPAPIDPRIRARRIEVRRVEGRRRLQRVLDLAVVATVALGFLAALWTPLLDVDEVQVRGATATGADLVLERAGIQVGDQLVSIDLDQVGERLAALPWVREVRLHRRVSGVVSIEVQERTAVAALQSPAGTMLVDREGRVLGPQRGSPTHVLPALIGVDGAVVPGQFLDGSVADVLAVAAAVTATSPGALVALRPDGLIAELASGGEVRFGDATHLDAKVRSLRTVLDQVDLVCLGLLDLRLPGSPVLTREERCS